jgi:hypothetical protein
VKTREWVSLFSWEHCVLHCFLRRLGSRRGRIWKIWGSHLGCDPHFALERGLVELDLNEMCDLDMVPSLLCHIAHTGYVFFSALEVFHMVL